MLEASQSETRGASSELSRCAAPQRSADPVRGREFWLMAGVAMSAALSRLWWAWSVISQVELKRIYVGYETAYVGLALAHGKGFSDLYGTPSGPTAWLAPVYPLIASLAFRIFHGFSAQAAWALFALNIACETLTSILIYWIGRRCFGSLIGFAAALFWAIYFPTVMYAVRIWDSSLSALLATLAVAWFLLLLDSRPRRRDWIAFGLFWGIAALTTTTLILTAPLSIAALLVRWRPARRDALLALLVFALALVPWTVRNFVAFHKLIPIRANFGPQLWYGNHPGVKGPADEAADPTHDPAELRTYRTMGELQYIALRQRMAFQCIRQHPGEFLRLTCNRILFFWAGDGLTQLRITSACWSILAFSGLLMMLRTGPVRAMPFAGALLLYPLPYYATMALFFYRHPIDPLVTLLAFYACFTVGELALGRLGAGGRPRV